jgi:branched-chain amino acid transport system substrate-binding protein
MRMNKYIKVIILVVAVVLATILVSGCTQQARLQASQVKVGVNASLTGPASPQAQASEVRIGVIASLTPGIYGNIGRMTSQGAQLAAAEINANGGININGTMVPIKVIVADDDSTQQGGQTAATRLITGDKVDILAGGYLPDVTLSYEPIVAEYKVPFIVTGSGMPIITHRTDIDTSYIFLHCPTTDTNAQYMMKFIDQVIRPAVNQKLNANTDRPFRLALIYYDTGWGKSVQSAVIKTITDNNLNIKLVSQQSFEVGESDFSTPVTADFSTLLTAIKATNPDAVYIVALPLESVALITQARKDIGLNTLFLLSDQNDDPRVYKEIGQYGEGAIIETWFSLFATPAGALGDAQNAFKNNYYAKYGTHPEMMGVSTYEAVYIAAKAIENAGTTDKVSVRQALVNLRMPQIIDAMKGGTISFSSDFRESQFDLWMQQLKYNSKIGETKPKIVWPDNLKVTEFTLPAGYTPGSA